MRPPKAVVNAVRNLLLIATLAATTGRAGQSDQDESFLCSWYVYYWNPTVVINGRSKDYCQEDYGPDVVYDLACRFMEQNKAEPLFLRSFLPQLRGQLGNPRSWCYCWYTKYPTQQVPKEWARTQRYKRYRTGEFCDVSTDMLEQHPLTNLSSEAQQARTRLQQALDRYRDALLLTPLAALMNCQRLETIRRESSKP